MHDAQHRIGPEGFAVCYLAGPLLMSRKHEGVRCARILHHVFCAGASRATSVTLAS